MSSFHLGSVGLYTSVDPTITLFPSGRDHLLVSVSVAVSIWTGHYYLRYYVVCPNPRNPQKCFTFKYNYCCYPGTSRLLWSLESASGCFCWSSHSEAWWRSHYSLGGHTLKKGPYKQYQQLLWGPKAFVIVDRIHFGMWRRTVSISWWLEPWWLKLDTGPRPDEDRQRQASSTQLLTGATVIWAATETLVIILVMAVVLQLQLSHLAVKLINKPVNKTSLVCSRTAWQPPVISACAGQLII